MKKIAFSFVAILSLICVGCSSSQAEKNPNQSALAQKFEQKNSQNASSNAENNGNINSRNMDSLTKVLFKTSLGDITIALYDNTPKHRENFIKLVNDGFYTDILFHRIIQGFMIQTGDPDSKGAPAGKQLGSGGPGYTIPAEFRAENYHKRGAVAAARQGDQVNPTKASSGSQFYIVDGQKFDDRMMAQISYQYGKSFTDEQRQVYKTEGGAPFLDGDYTVFGEVVSGMDVVDAIAAQKKDRFDRPMQDVKIISAVVLK